MTMIRHQKSPLLVLLQRQRARPLTAAHSVGARQVTASAARSFARSLGSTFVSRRPRPSSSSLGLFDTLVEPHIDSLSTLPEVDDALKSEFSQSSSVEEGLKRAVQIFEAMGGPLHVAVKALLAEAYQQRGDYNQAITVLRQISEEQIGDDPSFAVQLALSKSLFYQGEFDQSLELISELLESAHVQSSLLTRGIALTAQGVVQMLARPGAEQIVETIKVLRVAARSLESINGTAGAAAYSNLGVSQTLFELTVDRNHVDSAMTSFRKGLDLAIDYNNLLLQGRIYNNMAQTLLLDKHDESLLKLASEYSRKALSVYEKIESNMSDQEREAGLGRALSLTASCYAMADAMVTAEGLFQSAIEMPGADPPTKLARRDAFLSYASLCKQWDKRQSDAERLESQGKEINDSLPERWRNMPGIASGIIFMTHY